MPLSSASLFVSFSENYIRNSQYNFEETVQCMSIRDYTGISSGISKKIT